VQPVAACRQSPYLHKPATVIVTSFSLWRLAPTALTAPVLTMTSFSLWRHSLLSWPRPPLRTYGRYGHLTAFNISRCFRDSVFATFCLAPLKWLFHLYGILNIDYLLSPCAIGQTIIFLPCGFFLLSIFFFSSPNLSGHRLDVYHTSTHGVALVRI